MERRTLLYLLKLFFFYLTDFLIFPILGIELRVAIFNYQGIMAIYQIIKAKFLDKEDENIKSYCLHNNRFVKKNYNFDKFYVRANVAEVINNFHLTVNRKLLKYIYNNCNVICLNPKFNNCFHYSQCYVKNWYFYILNNCLHNDESCEKYKLEKIKQNFKPFCVNDGTPCQHVMGNSGMRSHSNYINKISEVRKDNLPFGNMVDTRLNHRKSNKLEIILDERKYEIGEDNFTNILLVIAYRGGDFTGWIDGSEYLTDKEKNSFTNFNLLQKKSVYYTLLTAINRLYGINNINDKSNDSDTVNLNDTSRNTFLFGASRTDRGVHARGQVCQYVHLGKNLPFSGNLIRFQHSLNSILTKSIRILSVINSPSQRFFVGSECKSKEYWYEIDTCRPSDPFAMNTWNLSEDRRFRKYFFNSNTNICHNNFYNDLFGNNLKEDRQWVDLGSFYGTNFNIISDTINIIKPADGTEYGNRNITNAGLNSEYIYITKTNTTGSNVTDIKRKHKNLRFEHFGADADINNLLPIDETYAYMTYNNMNSVENDISLPQDIYTRHFKKVRDFRMLQGEGSSKLLNFNWQEVKRATDLLVGEHSFHAFRNLYRGKEKKNNKSTVCKIFFITIEKICCSQGSFNCNDLYQNSNSYRYRFRIRGDRFLYKMVRNIIGCLLEVGMGRMSVDIVKEMLSENSRSHNFTKSRSFLCAPPEGLTLHKVFFDHKIEILFDIAYANYSCAPT